MYASRKSMKYGELFFNSLTCLMVVLFLASIDYTEMDAGVVITSFLIGGFSLFRAMTEKINVSPRRVFYIFVFIFMFAAPLQQYSKDIVLWRFWGFNASFSDADRLYANILILVSLFMIELGYRSRVRFKIGNRKREDRMANKERVANKQILFLLTIMSMVSFGFLLLNGKILTNYIEASESSSIMIQIVNMAKYTPVAALIFYIIQLKEITGKSRRKAMLFLAVQLIIVSIIYFPFSGSSARFLLFGAYITIYAALFGHAKNKAIFLFGFIFGFFFIFSLFNVFKSAHMVEGIGLSFDVDLTGNDYDAYQILMTGIEYVRREGVCYGGNFLSALLCIIPRSILPFRMESSGAIFMRYFGSGFENVSCPIFAEFFFAFGWFGIIMLSYVLGMVMKRLARASESSSTYKKMVYCLVSGMLVYFSRGSLLASWSYFVGLLISTTMVYFVSQWYIGKANKLRLVKK